MQKLKKAALLLPIALAALPIAAQAEETLKVGVVLPMSGPLADQGKHMENGIRTYIKQHGDHVAGKKVEIIIKDDNGQPDLSKRMAQELVTRSHVDFLAGFINTPFGMAAAQVATASKTPTVVMNAAGMGVAHASPYVVKTSYTLPQVSVPMGQWAYRNGIRKVFTLVADYAPGHESEVSFVKSFTEAGGKVVGEVRVPPSNLDFSAYLQKIKDTRPDAVFVFLPAGEPVVGFMKGFGQRGLNKAGIKIIATEGWADADTLRSVGDVALGAVSTGWYSTAHDSATNRTFMKAYTALNGTRLEPDFMTVGAYDGMAVIYETARRLNGKIDGDKAMAVIKGMKIDSPRGPLVIDAATRDPIETVYLRRVERVNGKLENVEFARIEHVKDTGKQ